MKIGFSFLPTAAVLVSVYQFGCTENASTIGIGGESDAGPASSMLVSATQSPVSQGTEPPPYAPYDETADAAAEVEAAQQRASAQDKLVLLNFGANWCPDCRAFSRAMEDPQLAAIIDSRFVVAKIDVGNWDRNPDVVDEWDNPIAEGIPAVVVARPNGEILFATRRGQISTARNMGPAEFAAFFRLLAELGQGS